MGAAELSCTLPGL